MAFSFLYLAVRALLGALVRSRRGLHVKDIELLVLRTSSRSCAGRSRDRSLIRLIEPCWRPRPVTCRVRRGVYFS
jgi:hypothetical protein